MQLFHPDYYFHRVEQIDPKWLTGLGIRRVLVDADNTLTHHDSLEVSESVVAWMEQLKKSGISVLILSNNKAERVAPLAGHLKVPYVSRALKPLGVGVQKAFAQWGNPAEKTALIGDQIFTDVLCCRNTGLVSILVEPLQKEGFLFFRLKRRLEKSLLKGCKQMEETGPWQ